MIIEPTDEEVIIRLSIEEARTVIVDHGEGELVIPGQDDTLDLIDRLASAIRDVAEIQAERTE